MYCPLKHYFLLIYTKKRDRKGIEYICQTYKRGENEISKLDLQK